MIGKVTEDYSLIDDLSNVYFLGQKPYSELPHYAIHFDVGIIPYKMGQELMVATNPIKFKEYLALKIPVVTTKMAELIPYKDVSWIARHHDEFLEFIPKAMSEEGRKKAEKAREIVEKETWESKVLEMSKIIEAH